MPGQLILCATPIGNLGDVSRRLGETLAGADLIFAEDTRRSQVLLRALGIEKQLHSYFVGNEAQRVREISRALANDQTVALLTDAGMPAIADPGLSAVRAARAAGARVSAVPGPSALTTALAVSGLPSERFVFEGFLPRRGKARAARLAAVEAETRTIVMFVGANHLLANLADLAQVASQRELCIARELTKAFEEIEWTTCGEAVDRWQARTIKGEFTLVLAGAKPAASEPDAAVERVLGLMAEGESMAASVRTVAASSGLNRRDLYEAVLARTRDTSRER